MVGEFMAKISSLFLNGNFPVSTHCEVGYCAEALRIAIATASAKTMLLV